MWQNKSGNRVASRKYDKTKIESGFLISWNPKALLRPWAIALEAIIVENKVFHASPRRPRGPFLGRRRSCWPKGRRPHRAVARGGGISVRLHDLPGAEDVDLPANLRGDLHRRDRDLRHHLPRRADRPLAAIP